MNRMRALVPALLAAGVLAACATPPKPLQGSYAPLSPATAAQRQVPGDLVRWGGTIAEVVPQRERTCFELVGRPLDGRGRPDEDSDSSAGRFVACREGFYDPVVFERGRAVTVTGRIEGFETRTIGDFPYLHPRVAADVVYLWPEQREVDVIYDRGPYWGGYYGWW
ncbi:Slp family lipoprotein [Coralloluteibacterium stylophorae]|uniref:Slp family lipoprotein n=1 Tax=Coralloluteibacterium stylophorae TaxID=1776034 RepID=A0A8J8AY91_9GAMM|nr:Slp family lipoprotein [Coralloluteibacterium stylophorae]MBS7457642.1 Slp family lipoprotein [Coralloluteibacterium stylophorae]